MPEQAPANALATVALTAALLAAGCVDPVQDTLGDDPETQAAETLSVTVSAENVSSNLTHLGLEIDAVFVHNASVPQPDGYFELNTSSAHADLVEDGDAAQVRLGARALPPGTYDQVVLRVDGAEVESADGSDAGSGNESGGGNASAEANESEDGHDHDHGDHEHGDNASANDSGNGTADAGADDGRATRAGFDVPVNATFEVGPNASTNVNLVVDAGASTSNGAFEPALERVEVSRDGEVVAEIDDPDVGFREAEAATPASTPPPAARMTVFDGNGDKVHEPDFEAEDGAFVGSKADPLDRSATLSFSATESSAVADGAVIESYRWDFDDGTNETGRNVNYSFDQQGVFEVTLTVTDSNGVTDEHVLRLVVLQREWLQTRVNTSFEDGPDGWNTSGDGATSWELDGEGANSSTAWHVGHHLAHTRGQPLDSTAPGYTRNANAALTSEPVEIPANWSSAGFKFKVAGSSEEGFDELTIRYTAGNNTTEVGTFSGSQNWTQTEKLIGLTEARGETVTFTFTFTSDAFVQTGAGWYVDDFAIGGVDLPIRKAHLLEEGGHGEHDHEH